MNAQIIDFPSRKIEITPEKKSFCEEMVDFSNEQLKNPPSLERSFLIAMATGTLEELDRLGVLLEKRHTAGMTVVG